MGKETVAKVHEVQSHIHDKSKEEHAMTHSNQTNKN